MTIENQKDRHPASLAREFGLQFLYQMEADKVFYFSLSHFEQFVRHFEVADKAQQPFQTLVEGVFGSMDKVDDALSKASTNWSVERMPAIDRALLRIAVYELLEGQTPPKVVLNEAIELAKKYGTEQSGPFVNGILATVAKNLGTSRIT